MKRIITVSVVAVSLMTAFSASAENGNIEFTGAVTDTGCDIVVAPSHNASSTQTTTIDLKTTDKASLGTSVGATANKTAFALTLTNCPAAMTTASANFDYQAIDGNEGFLANTATTQNGVGMQLFDDSNGSQPLVRGVASSSVNLTSGSAVLPFSVALVNTSGAGVTAGEVKSSAQYTIVYQ